MIKKPKQSMASSEPQKWTHPEWSYRKPHDTFGWEVVICGSYTVWIEREETARDIVRAHNAALAAEREKLEQADAQLSAIRHELATTPAHDLVEIARQRMEERERAINIATVLAEAIEKARLRTSASCRKAKIEGSKK